MERLYLDYNCFQRNFNDLSQVRIQMEALACQHLFLVASANAVEIVWSFMHEDESALCPYPDRREEALKLSLLCQTKIRPSEGIRALAHSYVEQVRLSPKDALHYACAVEAEADIFLTCDDKFRKRVLAAGIGMGALNPVDYVRRRGSNGS